MQKMAQSKMQHPVKRSAAQSRPCPSAIVDFGKDLFVVTGGGAGVKDGGSSGGEECSLLLCALLLPPLALVISPLLRGCTHAAGTTMKNRGRAGGLLDKALLRTRTRW
jgi:hypothetical protein